VNDTPDAPRVDRTPPRPEGEPLEALLWAIAGEIRANMQDGVTSDHSWLYDDRLDYRMIYLIAKGRLIDDNILRSY
jgi:hypothetical protein